MSPKILRQSPSGESFSGNPGDVLTCLGGDVWEAEPGGGSTGFTPRGTGAQFKTFFSTDQNLVYVTDFMTDAEQADCFNCTVTLDLQPAIQKAIDYAMYKNGLGNAGGPRVRLPGGALRIDRPIQVGYGIDIRSVVLEGEGSRFGGSVGGLGSGTSINPTFKDAPAIVVQGCYYTQIRNLSIFGLNQAHIVSILTTPTQANVNVATWIDPTFPASASSQFAVQCAIAIDPYSGPQPAVHYPAVNYPSFLGPQGQYNKGFSSNIKIENVVIQGFVAGVALQTSDADGNGDFIRLENVFMAFIAYCFVWGNSQARVNTLDNCVFQDFHTVLDNVTFGHRIGNAQVLLKSCQANVGIQLANMSMNDGQGPTFLHCFMEAMYAIGTIGSGASFTGSVQFYNCEFGMSQWDVYGVPIHIYVNGTTRAMATFRQSRFFLNALVNAWGGIHMFCGGGAENGGVYEFDDCGTILASGDPTQLWAKCALNATAGLSISALNTRFQDYKWRLPHRYNLDSGADLDVVQYGHLNPGQRDRCLPAYGINAVCSSFGADAGVAITWRGTENIATSGTPTVSGRNITVTYTGAWNADSANRLGGDVGDMIEHHQSGTLYWVYTRTGFIVSARAMSGFDGAGNLLSPPVAGATFSGLNCRRYTTGPDLVLYGDLTAGSPVITNVINGSGNTFTIANSLTVGDWYYQEQEIDKLFVSDAACKISAIDDTLHTITMGGNAVRTVTHYRLAIWTRAPMPNGTPTP